ncbi:MAG: hypothetical protein V1750_02030 [Acidobacteriota bacterium]
MSGVCVCVLACGRRDYYRSARQAALSVLERSELDLFVVHGRLGPLRLPRERVTQVAIPEAPAERGRAGPFLAKLDALAACLGGSRAPALLLLDSDAVFVGRIDESMVMAALAGRELAMAEQTTITRSGWTRRELRDHFITHSLAFLAPGAAAPPLEEFRFYNSGVVLGTRAGLLSFTSWARETRRARDAAHTIGAHMIADQDYFQVWANTIRPGACATLSWHWNHCEHWDEDFPRAGVLIAHLSNFCQGPGRRQRLRMLALRRTSFRDGRAVGPWGFIARHNPWARRALR